MPDTVSSIYDGRISVFELRFVGEEVSRALQKRVVLTEPSVLVTLFLKPQPTIHWHLIPNPRGAFLEYEKSRLVVGLGRTTDGAVVRQMYRFVSRQ
jgi:hypothetical protein